ncbi:MAG TPA: hypothetical protein VFB82_11920 [Blastocatellia bacterium]|jgi:hypothetical protein|nr:hypothetical protein [Blastocatellia bacterium]
MSKGGESATRTALGRDLKDERKEMTMDPSNLNALNENTYRVALMLIQVIVGTVGLCSVLFMVICTICAAWDYFGEIGTSARRRFKPVSNGSKTRFTSEERVKGLSRLNSPS